MKNMKTRVSALMAVFVALVMLVSALALPISATATEKEPILSDDSNEFGLTYENGVYTLSINAECLAEIISSRSFNKDALLEVMPQSVYDLFVNKDSESAIALLRSLYSAADVDALLADLPIDIVREYLVFEDFVALISIEDLLTVVDFEAIVDTMTHDEFYALFKEEKLEELIANIDLSGVLTDERLQAICSALTAQQLVDILEDGAIERIFTSGKVNFENILTADVILELVKEGIITEDDITSLLAGKMDIIMNDPILLETKDLGYALEKKYVTVPEIVALLDDAELATILEKEIVSAKTVIENVTDINVITKEIDILKVDKDVLFDIVPVSEFIRESFNQKPRKLAKALNLKSLMNIPLIKEFLSNTTLDKIHTVIDMEYLKGEFLEKIQKLIVNEIEYVKINETFVYSKKNFKVNVGELRAALYDAIPTVEKLASLPNDGTAASLVFSVGMRGKVYNLGFNVVLKGNTAKINEYAKKLSEYISFTTSPDGIIDVKLKATDRIMELYIKAVDKLKLPDSIKDKLPGIGDADLDTEDIKALIDKLANKLTYDELLTFMRSVDLEKYSDKLLSSLGISASQAESIKNILISAINKAIDIADGNAKIEGIYNSFYDAIFGLLGYSSEPAPATYSLKPIQSGAMMDYYQGEGKFLFEKEFTLDLASLIPAKLQPYFTNTELYNKITFSLEFESMRKLEFINDGEAVYSALVPVGTDITALIAENAEINALGINWATYKDGSSVPVTVSEMPDCDVSLAIVRTADFYVEREGEKTFVGKLLFTELLDDILGESLTPPTSSLPVVWNDADLDPNCTTDVEIIGAYDDSVVFTDIYINGKPVATIAYYDEQSFADAVADLDDFLPEEDRFHTYEWSEDCLDENGNIKYGADNISSVAVAKEYTLEFTNKDGTTQKVSLNINNYEDILASLPTPAKIDFYSGKWVINGNDFSADDVKAWFTDETSTLFKESDTVTVSAEYTPIEYTLKVSNDKGFTEHKFDITNYEKIFTIISEAQRPHYTKTALWNGKNFSADIESEILAALLESPEITVIEKYTAVVYTLTFVLSETETKTVEFTIEDIENLEALKAKFPDPPVKEGFSEAKWDWNGNPFDEAYYAEKGTYDRTIKVDESSYVPTDIVITLTYPILDAPLKFTFSLGTSASDVMAAINEKLDELNAANDWYIYRPPVITDDPTTNLSYTCAVIKKEFTITFLDKDGNQVGDKFSFNVDTVFPDEITLPTTLPEYAGYTVEWPALDTIVKEAKNLEVSVICTPIEYTAKFVVDGVVYKEFKFTVLTNALEEPEVPAITGYTGAWESYTIGANDLEIHAIYTLIKYTVTFVADGKVVATETYDVTNTSVKEPAVPEKKGYTGKWESYSLTSGDITVNAVYTPEEAQEGNSIFWWIMLAILLLALLICLILFFILTRDKDDDDNEPDPEPVSEPEPTPEPEPAPAPAPVIIPILEDVKAEEVDEILTDDVALAAVVHEAPTEKGGEGKKMFVNIGRICDAYQAGETVDIASLKEKGLLSQKAGRVKILADGHLDKALTVKADDFSAQAVKMILLTGGKAIQLD